MDSKAASGREIRFDAQERVADAKRWAHENEPKGGGRHGTERRVQPISNDANFSRKDVAFGGRDSDG